MHLDREASLAPAAAARHAAILSDSTKALARLREDVLRHIVALKMLSSYPREATLHLMENGPAWALRVAIPAVISEYDRCAYPTAQHVVVIEGNAVSMMRSVSSALPPGEAVLKTGNDVIAREAVEFGRGQLSRTFISFTGSAPTSSDALQPGDRETPTARCSTPSSRQRLTSSETI